jgi:hypothetical protein
MVLKKYIENKWIYVFIYINYIHKYIHIYICINFGVYMVMVLRKCTENKLNMKIWKIYIYTIVPISVFIWYNDIDVFYIENKVDICIYLHKLYIQIYIYTIVSISKFMW